MKNIVDELKLKDSYCFDVTVENNGTHFAGKLTLDPHECSLTVTGDVSENRQPDFKMEGMDKLICEYYGATFILFGLEGRGGGNRQLERHPKSIWHFEFQYKISYVVYDRAGLYGGTNFSEIEFDSPSVARWIGYTRSQDDIVTRHGEGTLFPYAGNLPTEFEQTLEDIGLMRICYAPSTHYSVETFSMGMQFPPILLLSFFLEKTGEQVIGYLNEIIVLFSFLIGEKLDLNTIRLATVHGRMYRASLYFSTGKSEENNSAYPWFPLGRNLKFDQMGLPEFPIKSLECYFSLTDQERLFFKKYLKYRDLENPEERFLGYFRLLEKLCHEKATYLPEDKLVNLINRASPFLKRYFGDRKNVDRLLERTVYLNTLKLSAASFIGKLLKKLPKTLTEKWIYGRSDINSICDLRNDLTHANELEPDEFDIENKAKFIEVLLTISLLMRIDVPLEASARIAARLRRHHLIEKPVQPVFSVSAADQQA